MLHLPNYHKLKDGYSFNSVVSVLLATFLRNVEKVETTVQFLIVGSGTIIFSGSDPSPWKSDPDRDPIHCLPEKVQKSVGNLHTFASFEEVFQTFKS